jgi:hypothetical protein
MRSVWRNSIVELVVMLLILALAVPAPVTAKKNYLDGKIMDSKFAGNRRCTDTSHTDWFCDFYTMIIQVEDMTYQAEYQQHGGLIGATHYKFKTEDWPINADVEVRFDTVHFLGIRKTRVYVKRSNGKEIELWLFSKTGADGKELCGNYRC